MERYESLGLVGEGSYGTVLKCRHRDSGRLVAIKKFVDSDDDKTVKKIALREIKLLRQLRHGNLVNLLEVWKRRRRWYLVFEFVERTLLDDLEQNPNGLDQNTVRKYLYQILRAAAFCHQQNIIHRDIKPENILISHGGVVKLCDFGFARIVASPGDVGVYTDYVATRWYRAPELLVGDIKYGKPVDVWAVGCLLLEMLTGQPLFPGDSDLDQIHHIIRCFGNLTAHHQDLFHRNPVFSGVRLPECYNQVSLQQRFSTVTSTALDLAQSCLQMDPDRRAQCSELLEHPLFTHDSFHIRFLNELNAKIQQDHRENSTLPKITKMPRRERDEGNEKKQRGKDKTQLEGVDEKVNKERDKKGKKEEEKMEKTKAKQTSKLSKTTRNISEPLMSTKPSKTGGAKVVDNAARVSVAMRSKPGKATCADLRKEVEISKSAKTLFTDPSEHPKTVISVKDNKQGKETREDYLESTKSTKDVYPSGLHSSCSETAVSSETEKNALDIYRSSKVKTSQEHWESSNNANMKVSKLAKSSTTDHKNESSPLKASLESIVSLLTPDPEQRTSECPKVLPANSRPTQSFTPTLPKRLSYPKLSKMGLKSIAEPASDATCVFNKSTKGRPKDRELTEVSTETKNQEDTLNDSYQVMKEDHRYLKKSPAAETVGNHIPISLTSGNDHKENHESSKTTDESRTSALILSEIPQSNHQVSDKENRDDLTLSVSSSETTKSQVNQTSIISIDKQMFINREVESVVKSVKFTSSKYFISTSTATVTQKTQKTTFPTESWKKSDSTNVSTVTELTSVPSTATSDHRARKRGLILHNMDTADLHDFDIPVSPSSTPPPPPPPSSTPLLPPSSPNLTPSICLNSPAFSDHLTPGAGVHLGHQSLRCIDKSRHHGGTYSRLAQQSLSSHVASLPAQVSDRSLMCDRPFPSDRFNCGNGSSFTATKKKSDIHFPDLKGSMLSELKGRDGKHNKSITKDQRKDKQPVPSISPSEPQENGHDITDKHQPHTS